MFFLSAVLLSLVASLALNRFQGLQHANWYYSLAFLLLLFATLQIVYARKKNPEDLASSLIAGFVIRFLAGLIFLLIFSFVLKPHFIAFAIHFITHWLLFTLAEIAYLSATFRKNKPTSP